MKSPTQLLHPPRLSKLRNRRSGRSALDDCCGLTERWGPPVSSHLYGRRCCLTPTHAAAQAPLTLERMSFSGRYATLVMCCVGLRCLGKMDNSHSFQRTFPSGNNQLDFFLHSLDWKFKPVACEIASRVSKKVSPFKCLLKSHFRLQITSCLTLYFV